MLNNSATTHTIKMFDLFLDAKCKRGEEGSKGAVFTPQHFANGWDSIYVRPNTLPIEGIGKNMRKLVEPTLIITQKNAKMAFVLASENSPVYLDNEYNSHQEFGYIMAFRLAPYISPEYVFFMCKYDIWDHMLTAYISNEAGYGLSWSDAGITGDYDPYSGGTFELSPETLVRNIGKISVPSIPVQKERIESAKAHERLYHDIIKPTEKDLAEIVNKYLAKSRSKSMFDNGRRIGLLRELYIIAAGVSVKQKVLDILSAAQFPFDSEVISEVDLKLLSENLDIVFPMLINPSEYSWDLQGCFVQPQEVTDFMVKLADFPAGIKVYNPFAGLASFAIALPDNNVVGEEINPTTWAVAQIRMMAYGINAHISNADSFVSMKSDEKYDAIISSPVYLREKGHEISDIISELYDKLTDNGKLICLVPHSFLSSRKDEGIRERLISEKSIKGIVTIPNNIFTGVNISQDVILIQKGNQDEDVIMADASGATRFAKSSYRMTVFDFKHFVEDMEEDLVDFGERGSYFVEGDVATLVNYADIVGTNLAPSIYLTSKPKNGIPLSAIATELKERSSDVAGEYLIAGPLIPEAMHRKPYSPVKVNEGKSSKAKSQVEISGDAVIVAMVSGNIRTVYLEDFKGKIDLTRGFIKVLKPAEGVSAKYLAALLSTPIVADQIKAHCNNFTFPPLSRFELSQIFVPDYRSEEEREKLISEVLSAEMSELESELNETLEKHKREVRSTRHAMVQTLSSLSSNWEQLRLFAQKKNGQINISDTIGRVNPISVENLLSSIGYAISTLGRQVESLRFEKADWGADVEINPYGFINDYISTHSTPNIKMVNVGSDNTADIPDMNEETGEVTYYHTDALSTFYAPKRLLERIFNNIVANAKAHGFSSERKEQEIRFDWQDVNGDIVITIANNGLPLKEGVTGDDIFMSGFSTALNENSSEGGHHFGQGGFEIKSLMEKVGSVEIISEPDAEFPVIYKLTFTNTNTVRIL